MSDSDQPLESFFLATAPYALRKTKQREIFKAKQTKRGRKAGPPSRKALQQPHEYVEEPIITTDRPEPITQSNPSYSTVPTATRVQNTSNPCPKDSSEHHEHEEILNEGHYRPQCREIDDCPTTTLKSPPNSTENRNSSTPLTKIAPKVRTIERENSGEAVALATIPTACENATFSTASNQATDHSTRSTTTPDLQPEISPSNQDEIQPNFGTKEAPRGTEFTTTEIHLDTTTTDHERDGFSTTIVINNLIISLDNIGFFALSTNTSLKYSNFRADHIQSIYFGTHYICYITILPFLRPSIPLRFLTIKLLFACFALSSTFLD